MIYEEICHVGVCDNCQEIFNDGEYSMFALKSDVTDSMENSDWYVNGTDPDHKEKHYCCDCYKNHPDEDDKIIIDLNRKKKSEFPVGNEKRIPSFINSIEVTKEMKHTLACQIAAEFSKIGIDITDEQQQEFQDGSAEGIIDNILDSILSIYANSNP